MNTCRATYDGVSFVPIGKIAGIRKGEIVKLTIDEDVETRRAADLATFRRVTKELGELHKSEPLGADFDDVVSSHVEFARAIDL